MIHVHETSRTFHLQNDTVSYVITILPGGHPAQLYFGRRISDREEYGYLLEGCIRSHSAYPNDDGTCQYCGRAIFDPRG